MLRRWRDARGERLCHQALHVPLLLPPKLNDVTPILVERGAPPKLPIVREHEDHLPGGREPDWRFAMPRETRNGAKRPRKE
jgi:hypothetical protein